MTKFANVWVFSDMGNRYPELIAGASTLGENVSAVIIGTEADAAPLFAQGANAVYAIAPEDGYMVEDYAPTIAKLVSESAASALLLGATKRGKVIAAKIGVSLKAAVINELNTLDASGDALVAGHMVYGGLATGTEKVTTPIAVFTVSAGTFEPLAEDASRTGTTTAVAAVAPAKRIKCLERRPKQSSNVELAKAKRIVSVGRGLKAEADLQMVRDLAAAIEAEVGCSRPVAEGENWLERERYVGVTGAMVKADVYIALGISGQIQHMVGANGARTIVAVNKDKNAPIFQYADYGIVGDIYKVVPALTAALKN